MAGTNLLSARLQSLLAAGSIHEIEDLLVSNSNLPGPRGNLELAAAFADRVGQAEPTDSRWQMLLDLAGIPEEQAPTGDPHEFLPFCALQGLGAIYFQCEDQRRQRIVELLKGAAGDGRWRLREGVAMAFQRIGETDFGEMRSVLSAWLPEASLEGRRAIVAALAHPPILKDPENARYCLGVSDSILRDLAATPPAVRRTEGFKVLRQGLEYAVSVFVAPLPGEGFALLKHLATVDDADVKRVVKSNLGKARLAKKYPQQVAETLRLL